MANWNPWHGCHKLSAGCKNCYVYRTDARYEKDSSVVTKTQNFRLPVMKKRDGSDKIPSGELVWTCFTSDFLVEDADEWRQDAWEMMRIRSDLSFLFITKRIDRLEQCLPDDWGIGYPNVHICCTVENQEMADYRLPIFRSLPICRKTIVCEPLLERINLREHLGTWAAGLLVGGESGTQARVCDYEWVLDLRAQAIAAGVPFYFKQTGAYFRKDGKIYHIERKFQHSQAAKAGINWNYNRDLR
ncbi:MAG: DUF5131 family protein [Christensenellaceae bacterium]|nr:DUF5131 family protein [Christensenellaceae bacterium]